MGVDTKGVIATRCKDPFFVATQMVRALDRLIQPEWKQERAAGVPANQAQNRLCEVELLTNQETLRIHFTYKGELRMLWVFFGCDCDHQDLSPTSISLSMGCFGQSELFVKTALASVAMLGPLYFDYNDSDDVELSPWEAPPQNFLEHCAQKGRHCSQISLKSWHARWQRGELWATSAEQVFGMPAETVERLLGLSYDEANLELEQQLAQHVEATAAA